MVRPVEGHAKHYRVIASNRQPTALRDVHKGEDPKVACTVRQADDAAAAAANAMSLLENFAREPMHPLDETEAFDSVPEDRQLDVWKEMNCAARRPRSWASSPGWSPPSASPPT